MDKNTSHGKVQKNTTMTKNCSFEIANAIFATFTVSKKFIRHSNSQADVWDSDVLKHLKEQIAWKDLTPDQLHTLGNDHTCFYNNSSGATRSLREFIVALDKFDNQKILSILSDGRWFDNAKVLLSHLNWNKYQAVDVLDVCKKINKPEAWELAFEKFSFSHEELIEFGKIAPDSMAKKIFEKMKPE